MRIGDIVHTMTADLEMGIQYRVVSVDPIQDIWKLRPYDPQYEWPREAVRYVRGSEIIENHLQP